MCVGRNKAEVFGFLTNRIGQKLQGWMNKELPRIGKIRFLKLAA